MSSDLHGGISMSSTIIREVWIEKEMQKRAKEFTENKKLTVFIGTWNVNAKKPSEDLEDWLIMDAEPADIYCVGFQEIVDLNAGNLLVDHNAAKPWEDKIEHTLKQQFKQVASKHLVGLSLCVYVKRALFLEVSDISAESVGVGIMGVGGNKGAVGIRFNLYNSSLCFINSHLAAHQHNSAGRNSDYQNICSRMMFQSKKGAKSTLFEHDHLFWLGDLNYRLSLSDLGEVFRRIEDRDWVGLMQHDQLLAEKGKGNAFKYFKEGAIDFAPTYKYQPGTNLYERREDKKKRCPAYCDRIQWIGEEVVQLCYKRCETLKISDHKPVMSLFEIAAKEVINDKKRTVYESLIRQLDSWENQAIPKVEITPQSIDFGVVKFEELRTQKLVIENTGAVTVVEFHFVPKKDLAASANGTAVAASAKTLPSINTTGPKWLHVSPEFGIIPPHESIEITISMHVTADCSHAIQTGAQALEDILILTLENGRDYFLPVQGDYQKSCLGTTIEYLVNEIWRMVDFLFTHGLREERLFVTSGEKDEIDRICEDLDTGREFDSYTVHSMAESLIYFLKSLAEPIFPPALVDQYAEGTNLTPFCKQALLLLTPAHYNTFIYLVSFLRECLKHAEDNRLTPTQLVLVFAGCLMHCQVDGTEGQTPTTPTGGVSSSPATGGDSQMKPKAWVILRHYLTSDEFV